MSVYYYFGCEKCRQYGGFMSMQAWGIGNFDMVESFKFIMVHILSCGEENLRVLHEDRAGEPYKPTIFDEGDPKEVATRVKFLQEAKYIFPRSNDWELFKEEMSAVFTETEREDWKKFMAKWEEKHITEALKGLDGYEEGV